MHTHPLFLGQTQRIALGQQHSCYIGNCGSSHQQRLYVWGSNQDNYLSPFTKEQQQSSDEADPNVLAWPTYISLKFNQHEYEPVTVSCGAYYVMVIGHQIAQKELFKNKVVNYNEDQNFGGEADNFKKISALLKQILVKKGSLIDFFKPEQKYKQTKQDYKQKFYREAGKADQMEEEIDSNTVMISRNQFITQISQKYEDYPPVADQGSGRNLSDYLFKNAGTGEISVQEIEDFTLGFMQNEIKLFFFGRADQSLLSFKKKKTMMGQDTLSDVLSDSNDQSVTLPNPLSRSESSEETDPDMMFVVQSPTAILFPKFTDPIMTVSCGLSHCLAVTKTGKLYSWGNGAYGALGFNSVHNINTPQELEIKQNNFKLQIQQVSCGSMHSMAVTSQNKLFTWGTGKHGRLGHGHLNDVLEPKELLQLSNLRVINISAGESHSAAVTQNLKAYTWGNGTFGRLGHGQDFIEKQPRLVEDLLVKKVAQVSCGAFHTLAITTDGELYSFGQDKYGKLGLISTQNQHRYTPIKIPIFQMKENEDVHEPASHTKLLYVLAGFNHNLAITNKGKVLSWGFNGYSLLGRNNGKRPEKQTLNCLPLPLFTDLRERPKQKKQNKFKKRSHDVVIDDQKQAMDVLFQQSKVSEQISTQITQVTCTSNNTLILTNGGEIFVSGTNNFSQQGFSNKLKDPVKGGWFDLRYFKLNSCTVKSMACGANHVFAISSDDQAFGWGRNIQGQLGMGFMSESVTEPNPITTLADLRIQKAVCGENYSAVITGLGKIMVAGDLEGGKLGLGKAWASGIIMSFREIKALNEVKQIACGPNHMLAITKGIKKDNILYAWGGNWKCQLGVGTKDNQYEPALVKMVQPIEFSKICCGRDFSLAIQKDTNQLFMWGNYMMSCSQETDDFTKPTKVSWFSDKGLQIKDISVLNEYCLVSTYDNVFYWWGKFMDFNHVALDADSVQDSESSQDSQSSSEGSQSSQSRSNSEKSVNETEEKKNELAQKKEAYKPEKLFNTRSVNTIFSQTALGFNHAAAIQVGTGYLYCWGANDCLQMGMDEVKGSNFQSYQKQMEVAPVPIDYINQILLANKKKLEDQGSHQMRPNQEQDEEELEQPKAEMNAYQRSQSKMLKEDQNFQLRSRQNYQTEKTTAIEEAEEDFSQDEKQAEDFERKTHAVIPAGTSKTADVIQMVFDEIKTEMKAGQGLLFKERQKPMLANATTFTVNNIDGHIRMQIFLSEEQGYFDEQSMYRQDSALQESLDTILNEDMKVLQDCSNRRKNLQLQIKNTLLQRLSEDPLATLPGRDPLIIGSKANLEAHKRMNKQIKEALSTLHLHPCYLVNLYKQGHLDADQFYKVIKMIYPNKHPAELNNENDVNFNWMPYQLSQETERVNYLIISIVQMILEMEFKGKNIDDIDLVGPDCHLIGRLFKYVFKSQPTNIDTICCIVCHLVNQLAAMMLNDKEETGAIPGNEEDVKQSEFQRFLEPKALDKEEDMKRYFEILSDLVNDIQTNKILQSSQQQLFSQRKPVSDILKANSSFQYSSLRFSSEVSLLLEMIKSELKNTTSKNKAELDKKIQKKLFSMCFQMVETAWEDLELYTSAYFKNKKISQGIMLNIIKRKTGLNQLFEVIKCFFNGEKVYDNQDVSRDFEPVKNLQVKMDELCLDVIPEMLKNIIDRSSNLGPNMISFKNFENLVLHSLRCDNFTISVKTDLLSTLLNKLHKNKKTVALLEPPEQDSLFKWFSNFNQFGELKKLGPRSNFVLKLRLLSEMHMELSRCAFCNAILTPSYNTLEKSPIIEQYDPEDKECLFSRYTQVLSNKGNPITPDIMLKNDKKSMSAQLVAIQEKLKRTENFEMAQSIQLLLNGVDEKLQGDTDELNEEAKDYQRDQVFKQLLQEAQDKMNQRRKHSHDLKILGERIRTFLKKAVSKRLQAIKVKETRVYRILIFNLLYGLANKELLPLCQTEQNALSKMNDLKTNIYQQQFSKNLFKVLMDKQKFNLRTIIREPVVRLINNGTITDFKLESLRTMIDNLVVVVHETQQRNIELKIFFEEIPGCCQMSNSKQQQQLLKIEITSEELFKLRKEVRLIRYLTYLQTNATSFMNFGEKDQSAQELVKLGVKDVTKPLPESIVSVTYQNAVVFKKMMLLEMINRMLHQKYAYVFQSNFSTQSMIKFQEENQE